MDQKICPVCKKSAVVDLRDTEQSELVIYCSQCGKFTIDMRVNQWFIHGRMSSEMHCDECYKEIFKHSTNIQDDIYSDAMREAMSALVKQCGGELILNKENLKMFIESAHNNIQGNSVVS